MKRCIKLLKIEVNIIDYNKLQLVKKITKNMREILNISYPLLDVSSLVWELGGVVIKSDKTEPTLVKLPNSRFSIEINKELSKKEENFIIAKFIGELILFLQYQVDDEVWEKHPNYTSFNFSPEKDEISTCFAYYLIMPTTQFVNKFEETKDNKVNLTNLSDYFQVTEYHIKKRAIYEGYTFKSPF